MITQSVRLFMLFLHILDVPHNPTHAARDSSNKWGADNRKVVSQQARSLCTCPTIVLEYYFGHDLVREQTNKVVCLSNSCRNVVQTCSNL